MNYSNMIKNENTDSRYEAWSSYRKELTTYIKQSVALHCDKNSWIAIWGAGGCNDIDIEVLAKDYKLLLIDQDVDKLIRVRERLGISIERCRVADVGFWNITEDDYELFLALLMDKASYEEIELFIKDMIERMEPPISLEKYSVDCSVIVGLTSQLNARMAALVHLCKEKLKHIDMEKLFGLIEGLNKIATERLFVAIRQITTKLIVTGYETCVCYSSKEALEKKSQVLDSLEEGLQGGVFLSGNEKGLVTVAGNQWWHSLLCKAINMDKLEDMGRAEVMIWPFSEEKLYPMLTVTLEITGHKR